jgi:hypothetical protein
VDYGTWRLINASDPKGRAALEKFIEQASPAEIEKLKEAVTDTPQALLHLADALQTLKLVLKDRGLL